MNPYSKVYWVSEEQKKEIEAKLVKEFGSISEGIRNIVKFYLSLMRSKGGES